MSDQIHLRAIMNRDWRLFRRLLAENQQTQPLVMALPARRDIERAMLSKAYAIKHYPDIESMRAFDWMLETWSETLATAGRPATVLNQIRVNRVNR